MYLLIQQNQTLILIQELILSQRKQNSSTQIMDGFISQITNLDSCINPVRIFPQNWEKLRKYKILFQQFLFLGFTLIHQLLIIYRIITLQDEVCYTMFIIFILF